MSIIYDGKKIIPAPFVNIVKEYVNQNDKIGSNFRITLNGKLVTCKGSPTTSGTFWTLSGYPPDENISDNERLKAIIRKQDALRKLFATNGKMFEIQPLDGSQPLKFRPVIESIEFKDGPWTDVCEYTVTMSTPYIIGFPGEEDYREGQKYFVDANGERLYLQQVNESWQIEMNENGVNEDNPHYFMIRHDVNAVGQHVYDHNTGLRLNGWEQARKWVLTRVGFDSAFVYGTSGLNLPSYMKAYNHIRNESTDESAGSYGISETWILSSGYAIEDFTINVNKSIENPITQVSINGQIRGLEENVANNVTKTKYENAKRKYDEITSGTPNKIFTRAQNYAGISLNPIPLTNTFAANPVAGTISYTYSYDNRPTNYIDNALSEVIRISDNNPADVFAVIAVPGRPQGPILQDIGTKTEGKRAISIEVVMPNYSGQAPTTATRVSNLMDARPKAKVDTIINAFEQDLKNNHGLVFKDQDNESWEPKTGRYSRNVSFTYGEC